MEEAEYKLISENKKEDDEEEEELLVGLQVRRSKHGHGRNADIFEQGEGVSSIENDVDNEAAEFMSSSAVYFEGTESETRSNDVEKTFTEKKVRVVESFSNPDSPAAVEMSYEEENTNGDYLIEEDEEVDKALDVEGVIEKQKTYDFICPDCHSCITKRVILVKRKRKFPTQPMTENPPEQVIPEHDSEQDQDRIDNIEDPETDVFRCLSCFSLFIPSGNGFSLTFKAKRGTQNPNTTNKNSFFSFFGAYKGTNEKITDVKQGIVDTVKPNNSSQSPENIVSATVPLADTTLDISVRPEEGLKYGSNDVVQVQSIQEPLPDKSNSQADKETTDKDGHASTVNYFVSPSIQVIYNGNDGAKEDQKVGKDSLNSSIKDDRLPEIVIPQKLLHVDAVDQYKTGSSADVISTERGPQAASPEEEANTDGAREGTSTQTETRIDMSEAVVPEASEWDILKSTVYGGLVEAITSLGVVSSAAGAGAKTLNILGLALANLIGGVFVIAHHLGEMRNDSSTDSFSFRESDDRELKLAVVAASSLICITLLAAGKAHFQNPPKSHFKTIMYYVGIGSMTSGVSYVVGDLFYKLLTYLGLFKTTKLDHHGWSPY